MHRFSLLMVALSVCVLWTAGQALAQAGNEYQLPPVKLKPDRPTTAKPIPPSPDDRLDRKSVV